MCVYIVSYFFMLLLHMQLILRLQTHTQGGPKPSASPRPPARALISPPPTAGAGNWQPADLGLEEGVARFQTSKEKKIRCNFIAESEWGKKDCTLI